MKTLKERHLLDHKAAISIIENYGGSVNVSSSLSLDNPKSIENFKRLGDATLASLVSIMTDLKESGLDVSDKLISQLEEEFSPKNILKSPQKRGSR